MAASRATSDAGAAGAPAAAPPVEEIEQLAVEAVHDVELPLHEAEADNYARGHKPSAVVQDYEPTQADGSTE